MAGYGDDYVTPKPAGWTPMVGAVKETALRAAQLKAQKMTAALQRPKKLDASKLRPKL